jgi:hypothetical protein
VVGCEYSHEDPLSLTNKNAQERNQYECAGTNSSTRFRWSLRSGPLKFLPFVADLSRLAVGFDYGPGDQPHRELVGKSFRWL